MFLWKFFTITFEISFKLLTFLVNLILIRNIIMFAGKIFIKMEFAEQSIEKRIQVLDKLAQSHGNEFQHNLETSTSLLSREGLTDALVTLYEECCRYRLMTNKHVAAFVKKCKELFFLLPLLIEWMYHVQCFFSYCIEKTSWKPNEKCEIQFRLRCVIVVD